MFSPHLHKSANPFIAAKCKAVLPTRVLLFINAL